MSPGKRSAKNLSDVEEEDEDEDEVIDLEEEEEREKENEERPASKPKKNRKRKNGKDASSVEPRGKKNKTLETSSEQGTAASQHSVIQALSASPCAPFFFLIDSFYAQTRSPSPKMLRQHFQRTTPTQTRNEARKMLLQIKRALRTQTRWPLKVFRFVPIAQARRE